MLKPLSGKHRGFFLCLYDNILLTFIETNLKFCPPPPHVEFRFFGHTWGTGTGTGKHFLIIILIENYQEMLNELADGKCGRNSNSTEHRTAAAGTDGDGRRTRAVDD